MSHKQKVLDWIKHDRSLTGARNLYNSLPNKSLSFLASLNRIRSTEANVKQVGYQLCKAVGMNEHQLNALWQNKVVPVQESRKEEKEVMDSGDEKPLAEKLLEFKAEDAEWQDIQKLASDVSDYVGREAKGRNKKALLAFIAEGRSRVIEALEVPVQVRQAVKLREQFPFLREKDCPDVLKLLVNDLITAYENYKEGRKKLFDSMTQEEEALLAKEIVENFIENKQAFAELEHYAQSGQILGEHPIFEEQKIKAELEELSADELSKKSNALRKNISTNRKKAEEAEDPEAKAGYEEKVADYLWQEEYVKELLKKK